MADHMRIFVNLPVKDLGVSMTFFEKLGFSFNTQFTDDTAACMVIAEDIFAMLLTEAKFAEFTPKKIADAKSTSEILTALQLGGREAVDEMTNAAISAGGREPRNATDLGFMYSRSFEDPDGHIWEPFWMDPAQMPASGAA